VICAGPLVWLLATGALRAERDFRQVVVDYAAPAGTNHDWL
jgi:hypothetical protein